MLSFKRPKQPPWFRQEKCTLLCTETTLCRTFVPTPICFGTFYFTDCRSDRLTQDRDHSNKLNKPCKQGSSVSVIQATEYLQLLLHWDVLSLTLNRIRLVPLVFESQGLDFLSCILYVWDFPLTVKLCCLSNSTTKFEGWALNMPWHLGVQFKTWQTRPDSRRDSRTQWNY